MNKFIWLRSTGPAAALVEMVGTNTCRVHVYHDGQPTEPDYAQTTHHTRFFERYRYREATEDEVAKVFALIELAPHALRDWLKELEI